MPPCAEHPFPHVGPDTILTTIRHVRAGLDSASRTGDDAELLSALAELHRLAREVQARPPRRVAAAAAPEARQLFAELRALAMRGVTLGPHPLPTGSSAG